MTVAVDCPVLLVAVCTTITVVAPPPGRVLTIVSVRGFELLVAGCTMITVVTPPPGKVWMTVSVEALG